MNPLLYGLLGYVVLMLAVGIYCYRYMKSLDDFVLGGRRLGPWVAAISERASGESSWFLLGLPGAAYGLGFTEYWSVIGIAGGILASWTFIAVPLRRETARLGALTLPDYFELRFGDKSRFLRVVSMLVILVFYTFYIAAQLHGAKTLLNTSFEIEGDTGLIIGAIIVLIYTLLGGFLAVAWTDLIQGLMMTAVAVVLPIAGIAYIGGPGVLIEKLQASNPGHLWMGGEVGQAFVFGAAVGGLSWGLGYMGQPHLLTRYMALRKTSEARTGGLIAMGWTLISYWGAPMIGIVALVVLGPDLAPETVMPALAEFLLPGWLAGIMIAGATAAMMSTADSQLLAASSTLIEDVYVRIFKPDAPPGRLVLLSRVATTAVMLIALGLALNAGDEGGGIIYQTVAYAWTGLGASFGPPLLLALWWRRTNRNGALAGMLGGMIATIVWKNSDALQAMLDMKVGAVLVSAVLVVSVSLLTSRSE